MQANAEYNKVDVVKKKSSVGAAGKFIGMALGIFGIVIGALMCLTIIGAIIGFPLMVVSLGVMVNAQGFQLITCPECGKKQKVLKTKENFECTKCRKLTVINWK